MKRYILYTWALLLALSCASGLQETREEMSVEEPLGAEFISTKVVNTSERSVPGSIIVKSAPGAALDLRGVEFDPLKINSIERVFPVTPKRLDEQTAKELASWYVIRFDEGVSLNRAAKLLSDSEAVELIQFNQTWRHLSGEADMASVPDVPFQEIPDVGFNDPLLVHQWNYINSGATSLAVTAREGADVSVKDAWKLTTGDPSVIVAVVDQGIQYNHPDLEANMWINEAEKNGQAGVDDDNNGYIDDIYGYNFVTDGPISWTNPGDNGHGTHVAGTVAAVNNNGIGVCGIAGGDGSPDSGVRLMCCQAFNGSVGGDAVSVARAIIYAADMGAAILQASLGSYSGLYKSDAEYMGYNSIQAFAMQYFMVYGGGDVMNGGILIFAAGNDGGDMACYPGAMSDIISVTAVGPDMLPTTYINYGPGVNICAPGGDVTLNRGNRAMILSTVPTSLLAEGYGYQQGTSMACPHVSGVAALGLSYAKKLGKNLTAESLTSLLLTSVNDVESQLDRGKTGMKLYDYHGGMGTGLVDAWKLLMNIEGTPSLVAPINKEAYIDLTPVLGGSPAHHSNYEMEFVFDAPTAAKMALGIEGEPAIEHGKLKIKCTKAGSAKGKITLLIDRKETAEDGDRTYISKNISIISRSAASSNGGWL